MATTWKAPTWRMPNEKNQSKFESYSLDFDGSNDYVDTGDAFTSLTSFSISAWFKSDDTSTAAQGIVSSRINSIGSSQGLDLNISGDVLYARVFNNGATEVTTAFTDTASWHHVAMIYNGTTLEMYLDGVSKGTATGVYTNSAANWVIGKWNNGANYFNGSISDLTFFDYAISSDQVSSLYNSGSPINPMTIKPAPIAYYPLGGNASTGGDSSNTLSVPNVAVPDASVFDFDPGSNNYIEIPNNSTLQPSNITVSCWVNVAASGSAANGYFINKIHTSGNSVSYGIYKPGAPTFIIKVGGVIKYSPAYGTDIQGQGWHHLLGTYDGSHIRLYVNGVEVGTGTAETGAIEYTDEKAYIGSFEPTLIEIDGEISNAQIWNTALSASEVTTLYNSGVPLLTGTQPQEANLKAWWKLNESANWEADAASTWQIPDNRSAYPQSFNFDGSNDYIDCGTDSSLNITGNLSVSTWFKTSNTGSNKVIVNRDTGASNRVWQIAINSSNKVIAQFRGASTAQATSPLTTYADGKWHHAVAVYEPSVSVKLYIDGDLVDTDTTSIPASLTDAASTPLYIGAYSSFASEKFNGEISNNQVWDTNLSASQVTELYNNGVPLTTAIATDNLKAWYKLDNTATFSTNWSVPDASGNGNTGTSSGMTEQNLVNNNVSVLNGESSGMDTSNLVTSTLTRQIPYNSYSLNFDGISDAISFSDNDDFSFTTGSADTPFSISFWVKPESMNANVGIALIKSTEYLFKTDSLGKLFVTLFDSSGNEIGINITTNNWLFNGGYFWNNITVTYDGSSSNTGFEIYLNGQIRTDVARTSTGTYTYMTNSSNNLVWGDTGSFEYLGLASNLCLWKNTELNQDDILKIYNSGVPGDLSGFNPNPIAWWSLGSDSYYNGSNWICPDLISTNNGTSANMDDDALIGDAPNSTANGTSTNMSVDANLTGNAPNSSNNSFSVNMDYADRETSVPS